jgi:D-glycero-D-manno-heptose 1,7-bisphosphate phosphatase
MNGPAPTPVSGRRAVFLDRDGVLIRDVNHLTSASQIEILPGVPEALRRLHDAGWTLIVATNQSVVARGLVTEDELREIHRALEERLRRCGATIDAVYYCPHHPHGAVARYRQVCDCRKPEPGLLLRAADELGVNLGASVMVGDTAADMQAGRRAGCRTVLIRTVDCEDAVPAHSLGSEDAGAFDYLASDLQEASEWIARPPESS